MSAVGTCSICRLVYVNLDRHWDRDPERHREILQGRKRGRALRTAPTTEVPGLSVVHVTPDACDADRAFVWNVAATANRETRLNFGVYEPTSARRDGLHAFLGFVEDRAAGLVVMAQGGHVWPTTWADWDCAVNLGAPELRGAREPHRWIVTFAHVAAERRRQGIAKALVIEGARGVGVPPADLAYLFPLRPPAEAALRHCLPFAVRVAR